MLLRDELDERAISKINKRFKRKRRVFVLKLAFKYFRRSLKFFAKFVLGEDVSRRIWNEPFYSG